MVRGHTVGGGSGDRSEAFSEAHTVSEWTQKRGSPRHTLPCPQPLPLAAAAQRGSFPFLTGHQDSAFFPGVIWSGFEGSALTPPCTQRESPQAPRQASCTH